MAEIKVAKKTIFSPGKNSWSSPQIIPQSDFYIGQVLINKYGLKLVFGYSTYRKYIVVLHYIHHIQMACLMKGGGGCQKAEKRINVPAHQVTHFHIFCLKL